ncbi:MAG: hypothetical protein ACREM1_02840 [Longimicrobiales bacterium]
MSLARGHLRMVVWHARRALGWTGVSLRTRLWMGTFHAFIPLGRVLRWLGFGLWIRRQAREWDRRC